MKKNSEVPKTDKSDFEQKTRVLLEEIHHQVKTVAEQYSDIVEQMSEIKSDVKDLKNDMAIVKPVLEMHTTYLREIKSELGSVKMVVVNSSHEMNDHEKRIKKVEEKVFS
ncbi:MAG: hypothetical protein NTY34_08935 [Candidatus Omnitrophica bacterium]|nr:hypothetical protein [Candidatus Omnitrophota bacterium]